MIPAFAPCQKDAGIMEYWNTGMMVPFEKTQYTNIPSFQVSEGANV